MYLSDTEVEQFRRDGYLFFPNLFSQEELSVLRSAESEIINSASRNIKLEESNDAIRMIKGMHMYNDILYKLSRHPRLVEPAEQLLESKIYIHQTRLVLKEGLKTSPSKGYPWHQDYSTFLRLDGMLEPRAVVIAVFLDDVTPCNAPLMLIPGSHKKGLVTNHTAPDPDPKIQLVIEGDVIRELVEEQGIIALLGPAGSAFIMDVAMVHGSSENISPMNRAFYYIIFNSIENKCTNLLREDDHEASGDFTTVKPLLDDCLLALNSYTALSQSSHK
jgi:ectoine hydroxylase